MAPTTEIPSDAEVCAALQRLGSASARALLKALEETGHNTRDSQWAIQRCLDRGKIIIGAGLNLTVAVATKRAA